MSSNNYGALALYITCRFLKNVLFRFSLQKCAPLISVQMVKIVTTDRVALRASFASATCRSVTTTIVPLDLVSSDCFFYKCLPTVLVLLNYGLLRELYVLNLTEITSL